VANLHNVLNVTNSTLPKIALNSIVHPQNASTVKVSTQRTTRDVPNTNNIFSTPKTPVNINNTHTTRNPPPHPYTNFPSLRTPPPQTRPSQTWAQIAAQSPNSANQQPPSSTIDSIKSILTMFDFHKLSTSLRSLALQLQTTNNPIIKIVAIVDTVLACLSSSS